MPRLNSLPRGSAKNASLRQARQMAVVIVVATAALSYYGVTQVSRLAGRSQSASASEDGSWQDMISKVEHNLESHLPQQIAEQLHHPHGATQSSGVVKVRSKQQIGKPKATQMPKETVAATVRQRKQASLNTCNVEKHTEYGWGDVVVWGSSNKLATWGECCDMCLNHVPKLKTDITCNAWVWCGDKEGCGEQYQECWLKYIVHPEAAVPRQGPNVQWTSGLLLQPTTEEAAEPSEAVDRDEDRSFHVVITAEGAATHWQSRLHYYWYTKIKAKCQAEGDCQMGGFTRLLHSGKADDLMNEIPTWVAQPLPRDKHDHKGYVVLNRPYAFVQWVEAVELKERYVIMSEPDHVWLKPMPNLMKGSHPAAFPFFYIQPATGNLNLKLTKKYTGNITRQEAEKIAPIGNAPTMISWEHLKKVAPMWMNTSLAIFHDEETAKEWGWVQEMYAFTLACFNAGVGKIHLHKHMMAQPPWDSEMDLYYLLHFTYGMDFKKDGTFTPGKYGEWRFDKRTYAVLPPPRNLGKPPAGMNNQLVRHLINAINEATAAIPGWDEYAATGIATETWDGTFLDAALV